MRGEALTLPERVQIEVAVADDESAQEIAGGLGRSPSTITREFTRNGGRSCYRAVSAQARAERKRARPKATVFETNPNLAHHVAVRLRALDLPMTIAIELDRGLFAHQEATVSHETIYRGVYAHGRGGLAKGLHGCLHRRRRRRKHRHPHGAAPTKRGPLGEFNLILERPAAAEDRGQVGHLEGDLIVGAFNRSAIATVFDRASRHVWLAGLPNGHGADEVLYALIDLAHRIPAGLRRTLTWDQGREMARHHDLTEATAARTSSTGSS